VSTRRPKPATERTLIGYLLDGPRNGARRGVVLAPGLSLSHRCLRWTDLDERRGVLQVDRELIRISGELRFAPPKSETSVRIVPVPGGAIEALRDHRSRQDSERLALGELWVATGVIFASAIGTPLEPRNVNRWFDQVRKRAGLPWLRLHDLRHACAIFMVDQGADLRTIKETLGHSQLKLQ
jgi:integrase